MRIRLLCLCAWIALSTSGAVLGQDVTLTARDGSLSVDGTLVGFDGEFYRIESAYGPLTLDGQGVICEGPGCPDLTAPFAAIRIVGVPEAATGLLLPLWTAFARDRGMTLTVGQNTAGAFEIDLADPVLGQAIARITFAAANASGAATAMNSRQADLALTYNPSDGAAARVVALDALVPITSRDNPLPRISTTDLARALTGQVVNWAELGGPDMPLVLHALVADTSLEQALERRLGNPVAAAIQHPDQTSLAIAVARDPYALAITSRSALGPARALPLTDSCGFPLDPSPLALKADDYPLSMPLYLETPRRRLPLIAREFLDFLSQPAAQQIIAQSPFVGRGVERRPLTDDGMRLINAIQGAGKDVSLPDLQRLAVVMAGADRLSLTFRFEGGSATLDTPSQENLDTLAKLLMAGSFRGQDLVLAGFTDGAGAASENLALSRSRAEAVAAALSIAAPDLPPGQGPPMVEAFGEAMPMACDTTSGGSRLNRRVELWVRPAAPEPTKDPEP